MTPSTRSATGDLWSGVGSGKTSPVVAAQASAVTGGDTGSGVVAGLAILGLGVAGLAGAFVVLAGRRRRAVSGMNKR